MALLQTNCPKLSLVARGKVRDIYEVPGDEKKLLFVATDRVSAFDIVMKNGIPNKGKLLTKLSVFFFKKFESVVPNHLISSNFEYISSLSDSISTYKDQLEGRTILVKRCKVLKCEAIVRGYLTGSAYSEYQRFGSVHGITVAKDLIESSKFPKPIFTPSTKAEEGNHDENIHPNKLPEVLGSSELAKKIEQISIDLYNKANEYCLSIKSSLFLADTKFEFGIDHDSNDLLLIDECLTPDSSRFWSVDDYQEGKKMSGFDKQFLRDWLKSQGISSDTQSKEGIEIPQDIIESTWLKYTEAYKKLTGEDFSF
ncbi:phosphoribosylaminoimidazole-succinocarboxamide synthase [Phakopsora pachyrhizi]|uniref:Phosphoribosylaminoimidazole-succinocarboxamide synthase n=1 Tax=Phakopsora pachyrhizi TaxID=170000 RepID=A0AAV0AMB0_PHAPC|nr:phosphoribosylaminoimidazole-succinocarboxamide synthase [Phakopsora pachyrhizi]CAH7668262.1 phosphoribosylaminoimidazole-succinocarboxamide synthase [Phakopsora pachyrhizi]